MKAFVAPRSVAVLPRSFGFVPREMDELLERLFNVRQGQEVRATAADFSAPAEVWEEDGSYQLQLDLPGVTSDSLDITFEDRQLSVKAERKPADPQRKYLYSDRGYGTVERTITLPEQADPNTIEAKLTDGVLHISIQKRPELQPKKINVKTN